MKEHRVCNQARMSRSRDPELNSFLSRVEQLDSERSKQKPAVKPKPKTLKYDDNDFKKAEDLLNGSYVNRSQPIHNDVADEQVSSLAFKSAYNYDKTFSPKKEKGPKVNGKSNGNSSGKTGDMSYSISHMETRRVSKFDDVYRVEETSKTEEGYFVSKEDYEMLMSIKGRLEESRTHEQENERELEHKRLPSRPVVIPNRRTSDSPYEQNPPLPNRGRGKKSEEGTPLFSSRNFIDHDNFLDHDIINEPPKSSRMGKSVPPPPPPKKNTIKKPILAASSGSPSKKSSSAEVPNEVLPRAQTKSPLKAAKESLIKSPIKSISKSPTKPTSQPAAKYVIVDEEDSADEFSEMFQKIRLSKESSKSTAEVKGKVPPKPPAKSPSIQLPKLRSPKPKPALPADAKDPKKKSQDQNPDEDEVSALRRSLRKVKTAPPQRNATPEALRAKNKLQKPAVPPKPTIEIPEALTKRDTLVRPATDPQLKSISPALEGLQRQKVILQKQLIEKVGGSSSPELKFENDQVMSPRPTSSTPSKPLPTKSRTRGPKRKLPTDLKKL